MPYFLVTSSKCAGIEYLSETKCQICENVGGKYSLGICKLSLEYRVALEEKNCSEKKTEA